MWAFIGWLLELVGPILKIISGYQSKAHDEAERQAGSDASQVKAQNEDNARISAATDAGIVTSGLPDDSIASDPDNRAGRKA